MVCIRVASMQGAASVDITSDNQAAFDEGVASVDITSDNDGLYQSGFDAGLLRSISLPTIRLPLMRVWLLWTSLGQPSRV